MFYYSISGVVMYNFGGLRSGTEKGGSCVEWVDWILGKRDVELKVQGSN